MIVIETIRDGIARKAFGLTPSEAETKGECLSCKEQALPKCESLDDLHNWQTYSLCPDCINGT